MRLGALIQAILQTESKLKTRVFLVHLVNPPFVADGGFSTQRRHPSLTERRTALAIL